MFRIKFSSLDMMKRLLLFLDGISPRFSAYCDMFFFFLLFLKGGCPSRGAAEQPSTSAA